MSQLSSPILTFSGAITEKTLRLDDEFSTKLEDNFSFDPKDLKEIDQHYDRIIEGFANTTSVDRVNDLVSPNAFNDSLEKYRLNPVLRYNHKVGEVIGRILKIRPTEKGLWIKAKIFKDIAKADDVWKLVLQGGLRAFSVYGVIKEKSAKHMLDGKAVQHVTKFDLQEIAIVDVPADPDSLFKIVSKSVDNMTKTEKQMTTESTNLTPVDEKQDKEVGNEAISTDSTVEKMLTQISTFQQKTLEVLVTLAESNTAIVEKLAQIDQTVAKGTDEFGEEEEFEDEDEEFEEEEFEEKSVESSNLEAIAKRLDDLAGRYEKEEELSIKSLDQRIATIEGKTEVVEEVTDDKPASGEADRDLKTEEAVRKAVSTPNQLPEGEEAVEKSADKGLLRQAIVSNLTAK